MKNIDTLKGLAIAAVVLIHLISNYLFVFESWQSQFWQNLVYFDGFLRFCVPLFVALSGFGLASKYLQVKFKLGEYFSRRLFKLLPEYLFWSLIFYFLSHNPLPIWEVLIYGKADYHLYFVPMIFCLYLLFPILFILVKKLPKIMLGLTLTWQICWYWIIGTKTEISGVWPKGWTDQDQYLFFGTWIFYFVLGIYLAICTKIKYKLIFSLLTIVFLIWIGINSFGLIDQGVNLVMATRFTRLPVLGFASMVIILSLSLKKSLPLFYYLGKASYSIYLCHTLVLRILLEWFMLQRYISIYIIALITLFISVLPYTIWDSIKRQRARLQ